MNAGPTNGLIISSRKDLGSLLQIVGADWKVDANGVTLKIFVQIPDRQEVSILVPPLLWSRLNEEVLAQESCRSYLKES